MTGLEPRWAWKRRLLGAEAVRLLWVAEGGQLWPWLLGKVDMGLPLLEAVVERIERGMSCSWSALELFGLVGLEDSHRTAL